MTKKYIVKNCPNYNEYDEEWNCLNTDVNDLLCVNCTDCLIKQVVEKCKFRSKICKDCGSDVCFECEHLTGGILANELLQLFAIEEVE